MSVLIDPVTGQIIQVPDGSSTNPSDKGSDPNTSRDTPSSTSGEASSKVKNQVFDYMEGVVGLLPNPAYRAKRIYNIQGVGAVFNGNYYFKKIRHTIGATYDVEADVAKIDQVVIDFRKDTERNRPPAPPEPTPAPATPKPDYNRIERWGTVTANSGLNVRNPNSDPTGLKVNSSGSVVGSVGNATVIGALSRGKRIKVAYKKGDWYQVYYGDHGGWCYASYIRLD
jgi:hypothetical protein